VRLKPKKPDIISLHFIIIIIYILVSIFSITPLSCMDMAFGARLWAAFFPTVDSYPAPFGFVLFFFWAVPLISIFQHSFVISKPVYVAGPILVWIAGWKMTHCFLQHMYVCRSCPDTIIDWSFLGTLPVLFKISALCLAYTYSLVLL